MAGPDSHDDEFKTTGWDPYVTRSPTSKDKLGEYSIQSTVGQGGMGTVYKAQRSDSSVPVALKTVTRFDPRSLHRFKQEFRILADLSHPNLVQLGELVTTESEPYFTMEFVNGVPFNEYVRCGYDSLPTSNQSDAFGLRFDEERLRDALRQTAEGLIALHQAGCLHRDLKPSNVLVDKSGRVVILDFGLAVEMEQGEFSNSNHEYVGTPIFMAPEQAARQAVTSAVDWFSLGVMLFEALTEAFPFEPSSLHELQSQKEKGPLKTPQEIDPLVPSDLSKLCWDLLNPDPQRRPSGREIISRLQPNKIAQPSVSVWIGREAHLKQLRQEWMLTREGAGRVVFVSGKSGIGKSSLVNRFLSQLMDAKEPIVILRGRCYENETVAYRGFDSLVDSLVQYLQRLPTAKVERLLPVSLDAVCQLFPAFNTVPAIQEFTSRNRLYSDPLEIRRRGILELGEMLNRLVKWENVIIFLDDIQWGDDDTAMIFCQLTQVSTLPRALFLCTYRSEDLATNRCLSLMRRSELPISEQSRLAEQLELRIESLSKEEATQLAAQLLQANQVSNVDLVEQIVQETGGDPLFIRAFVNFLVRQLNNNSSNGSNAFDAASTSRNYLPFNQTIQDVLWSEISELSQEHRQTIELIGAAGRPVPWQAITNLISFEQDPTTSLQSLRQKRMIRQQGDAGNVDTYHDKIRETVASRMNPSLTSSYCLQLATYLENSSLSTDAEFLGDLFRKADDLAKAGHYYYEAGKHAISILAFHRAASLFGQAIKYLNPSGNQEKELRVLYGVALANSARGADSAAQYLKAAELAEESEKPDWLQQAALRFLISGHVDAGVSALIKALRAVNLYWPNSTVHAVIGLLRNEAWLRIAGLRSKQSSSHDQQSKTSDSIAVQMTGNEIQSKKLSNESLIQQSNSVSQRRLKVCWSAAAGLSVVDPVRGSYFITENLRLSLKSGDSKYVLRALAAYVGHVAIGGYYSRSTVRKVLLETRRVAQSERHPYFAGTLLTGRGVAALLRGQWSLALRCCDRALVKLHDERCRDVAWEVNTARTFALWALQYQGNLTELARRQPELLRLARESNDLFASLNYGTQVMTHLLLANGQPMEARSRLKEDHERLSQHGFFVQHHNHLLANVFIDVYESNGQQAMSRLRGQWKNYKASFLSRVQQIRVDYLQIHCRALLAAVAEGYNKPTSLDEATKYIRKLKHEKVPYAVAMASAFEASLNWQQGATKVAQRKFEEAIVLLDNSQLFLFSATCRMLLAECKGEVNSDQAKEFESRFTELGVVALSRQMANSLVPGVIEKT